MLVVPNLLDQKKCKCLLAKRGKQPSASSDSEDGNISMIRKKSVAARKNTNTAPSDSMGSKDLLKTLEENEQAVMSFVPPENCERCLRISQDPRKATYELDFQESKMLQPLSSFFYFAIGGEVKNTSLGEPRAIEVIITFVLFLIALISFFIRSIDKELYTSEQRKALL